MAAVDTSCARVPPGTQLLLRTCVDRRAGDGGDTVAEVGRGCVAPGNTGSKCEIVGARVRGDSRVKYRRIQILPPVDKPRRTPALTLTVLYAIERGKPWGRDPIAWKLVTNLPIHTRSEAIEKLTWYARRGKIETFHKVLKSGCQAE